MAFAGGGRVLLTGAAGFVGGRLAARLEAAGADLVTVGAPGMSGGLDLADRDAVAALIAETRPDVVLHLAALSSVADAIGDPLSVWANVRATDAIVSALIDHGSPARLVFASTAEVYGASFNDGPCDEDAPLRPANAYARSKAACEYLLRDAASETLEVVALRLFNHSGPGQDERFVLPSFAAQVAAIEAGRPGPLRHGNLDVARDFSDVEDVLDAYLAVAADPAPRPGFAVFNVGSGEVRRLGDLLDSLRGLARVEIAIEPDQARMRPSDTPVAAGDMTRFRAAYGVRFERGVEDMLAGLLAWERTRR